MSDQRTLTQVPIVPCPQQVVDRPGVLDLTAGAALYCGEPRTTRQRNALRLLTEGVERSTGARLPVVCRGKWEGALSVGGVEPGGDEDGPRPHLRSEGYRLRIDPDMAAIRGADEAGLFYGVQTLLALLRWAGAALPCGTLRDWPDMPFRAYGAFCGGHAYWTNDPATQRDERLYRDAAAWCAANKLNHLSFETEILPDDEQLSHLAQFCRDHFVEPIPLHPFLCMNRRDVVQYVEADAAQFARLMAPLDRALRLVEPRLFCIAGDELVSTYAYQDRASIYTDDQRRRRPGHAWLLAALRRIHQYITSRGVRMCMWADGLIDERAFEGWPACVAGYGGRGDGHHRVEPFLPRDILLWDWQYEPQCAYPTTDHLRRRGFDTVGCPWLNHWNVALFAEHVHRTGPDHSPGMLATDWWGPQRLNWAAVPRAGDCFWSVGQYAARYPKCPPYLEEDVEPRMPRSREENDAFLPWPLGARFRTFKAKAAANPLLGIPAGRHTCRLADDDPALNGRILGTRSRGMLMSMRSWGGLDLKDGREGWVSYGVGAAMNGRFAHCRIRIEGNPEFVGSVAVAWGDRGAPWVEVSPLSFGPWIDLTEQVAGLGAFRFRLQGVHTGTHHPVLSGVTVDCEVARGAER